MTALVGTWHDAKHLYSGRYPFGDGQPRLNLPTDHPVEDGYISFGPLPGATRAIGMIDKPGIAIWRGQTVARTIAAKMSMFSELLATGGLEAAVKWASSLPDYQRDTAADIGSRVHVLSEQVKRGGSPDMTPLEAEYVTADTNAHTDLGIRPVTLEKMVVNLTAGYGGTFDEIAEIDGEMWLLDTKTWRKRPEPGRDMYAETGMQLAAYSRGEFAGLPGDPKRYRLPAITRFGVLHLRPDLYERGYSLIPFDVTDADYAGFLGLLAAYRWKQERSRVLIGEPLKQKETVAA